MQNRGRDPGGGHRTRRTECSVSVLPLQGRQRCYHRLERGVKKDPSDLQRVGPVLARKITLTRGLSNPISRYAPSSRVQRSTFDVDNPRYSWFPVRSVYGISVAPCIEPVVTEREGVVLLNLLFRRNAIMQQVLACMPLLSPGTPGPHSGFSGKYSQGLPNEGGFYMCHWRQYRSLISNLHFSRCWYARLSMTSRCCCRTHLLAVRMVPSFKVAYVPFK